MKTREEIITSMCYTYRHDYGIVKEAGAFSFEAGMAEVDRQILWGTMAQIFDNSILPNMEFKE